MKKTLLSILSILITTFAFSQFKTLDLVNKSRNQCSVSNHTTLKSANSKSQMNCDPSLEHYLKRPPIVSSFVVTEDRNEIIELVLKDGYAFDEIEMEFWQLFDSGWDINKYIMYDDGTHGDKLAGDTIFTNNEVSIKYVPTTSYGNDEMMINVNYKNNNLIVHTEPITLDFIFLNKTFVDSLEMPNVYGFENNDYLFTGNFIYYNKYNNWRELECNQYGGESDPNYIISKSLLYDFWGESVINNPNDKNLYMQVDLSSPADQSLTGQDMSLFVNSLKGSVHIHEILHLWIPTISDYLGYDAFDTNNGHHANTFMNTSGFLYPGWSRVNGIFCENSFNEVKEDNIGKYLYIDHSSNYELCSYEITTTEKLYFNSFELYLMNLIPIEEIDFPITSLKNIYNKEEVVDSNTGLLIGEKYYFDSIIEINKEQLIAAKEQMLSDLGNPDFLDASIPNNFFLTFSGNKSNLSKNEIKALWLLSQDLTTKDKKTIDTAYDIPAFYEATGGRAEITSNIPLPKQYTGSFFTTEYVTITDGENYNGWTESGEYNRTLSSTQYKDSIVTTHLTVNSSLSIDKIDVNKIKIYPNPSSTTLFIEWKDFKNYLIYNSLGQLIKSSNEKTVDISNLQSGLYIIKLVGVLDEEVYSSKIIVK